MPLTLTQKKCFEKISTHFLNGSCRWIWTPWGVDLEPGMGGGRIQGNIVLRIPSRSVGKRTPRNPEVLGSTPRGVIVDMCCTYFQPTVPFSQLLRLQVSINSWSQSLQCLTGHPSHKRT